ncbi:MAG: hypothetical protein PHC54_05475 [Candidatus Omnitrophica bacterium]|nr:hypothetical protein [Candidatus Omnitrophota bacterium]MDD5592649.1 hypothetical protein [Candidatus Omnitrophota bacterium]
MLEKRMQMSGKLEDEEGVLETLAAADAKTIVYNPKFKADPEKHESDPERLSGAAQPQLIGKIPASLSFQVRMRGSGTATTDPDWIKYLKACGFSSVLLKSINIGAITSGPFLNNELISGGTSNAQGRVVFQTVNGASKVYYVAVGTVDFQSGEVITGGTSGATATTSSVPSNAARAYRPILTAVPSMSQAVNQDGSMERLKGGRGNAKFSVASGGPGLVDFDFQGVDAGQADESFFDDVEYEETAPDIFKDGTVLLDSYHPKLASLDFDLGAKLSQRDDPEDEKGLLSYALTGRLITGTLVLEMVLAATFAFRAKFHAGTEIIIDITWGCWRIYFPAAQITSIEKGAKDGLANISVGFQANGSLTENDDVVIVHGL